MKKLEIEINKSLAKFAPAIAKLMGRSRKKATWKDPCPVGKKLSVPKQRPSLRGQQDLF